VTRRSPARSGGRGYHGPMALRALLGACVLLALAAPVADARPQIMLVASRPVAIAVSGLHALELVRVEVRRPGRTARRSGRASAQGRLAMAFPGVRVSRCDPLSVVLVGPSGRRAVLHRRPGPACGVP
jgi:hypothetical protein